MRKGTFSAKRAKSNSAAHNSRENAPKYLIGLEPDTKNYYELLQSDKDFILEAQQLYKNKIGQNMQEIQIPNLVQETVLTLQKYQNENDVKALFEKLNQKYGGHTVLEISVHFDEGHFEKDGIAFYPTKDILKKENDWFIKSDLVKKEFDIKVDINDFTKVYNHHAHVKFSMFDKELCKTARMQKKDMSERIKFVSGELGLAFNPDQKTSRIAKPVHQIKDEHHARTEAKLKIKHDRSQDQKEKEALLARIKELEKEKEKAIEAKEYSFRDMQKQITALENLNADQKKELHRLNTEINKTKESDARDTKIKELEQKLAIKEEIKEAQIEELQAHIAKGIPETIEGYDFRTVQQFITSLSIDQADKKDIHGLNNALKRSIKAGGGLEELKTLSLRIERLKAQETANKQKLTDLAVKIKAIPVPPPVPYSVETITPVIERRFLAIEEEQIQAQKKYEEQIKGEIAEKEVFADMVAELHHAYEHEPEKIEPVLIRQRDQMLKEPKQAYKTALQRRDQAYKDRLGREPKKNYSVPKMRVPG